MDLNTILHMNGDGKISYANHSLHQRTVISMVKPTLEESMEKLLSTMVSECWRIADLGCSSGPNTLLVVQEIIDIMDVTLQRRLINQQSPCLQVFLNDLFGNDFNAIFRTLPTFYKILEEDQRSKFMGPCFIVAAPGSFYQRLFPDNSLHLVHSSYALMFLSQIPSLKTAEGEELNKGNICIAKTSPPAVHKAYFEQFKKDFTFFLKCRAEELVPNGHMVLTTMGSIKSDDPLTIWELIGIKLNDMAQEGLIEEVKLDSFNMPYYSPTREEVKEVIEAEGSFSLQKLEAIKMDWDDYLKQANGEMNKDERAATIARDMRAVGEPILATLFGKDIMDDLFRRFEEVVLEYMVQEKCQYVNLAMSLIRKA